MKIEMYDELMEALNSSRTFVLCTVVDVEGSSPGKTGNIMGVFDDGTIFGTVGGGKNEESVRLSAVSMLENEERTKTISFNLSNPLDGTEPICGGKMKVFLQIMRKKPKMAIFGAGHIGRVLASLAVKAQYQVTILDERPEFLNSDFLIDSHEKICCPYEQAVEKAKIDAQTSVVIVTPGHIKDYEVLERALKTPARYIGVIGSSRKISALKKSLLASGFDSKRIESVFAPIGVFLGGDSPEEIAVSILAQVIAFRNGLELRFSKTIGN
ncbi:MAG: XdhC family protein [Candidatus Riflebacteria bacterium]|nr:XdhC family protein [Candidatus Riflebacteria bacterium]